MCFLHLRVPCLLGGDVMLASLAIGAIAGIILGLRFKVLVLVPAALLAAVVVTVAGIISNRELGMIALTAFGTVALLQIWYIVGGILEVVAPAYLPTRTIVR